MTQIAIIGGSSLSQLEKNIIRKRKVARTPYGEPSSPIVYGELGGVEILFLARHGHGVTIPPHLINYRANMWALAEAGATCTIAVGSVGALDDKYPISSLCIPDQIIDYTHSRTSTYFDSMAEPITHVDFNEPFSPRVRQALLTSVASNIDTKNYVKEGCYAAMQGPRFESKAEVQRLARDGNHIVGMTAMPEAVLAREINIEYALCTVITNDARKPSNNGDKGKNQRRAIAEDLREDIDAVLKGAVKALA